MERAPKSIRQILRRAINQAEIGLSGNLREDAQDFLDLSGIHVVERTFTSEERTDPNLPLIVTPNHYMRTRLQRRSLYTFSTKDSFIDSSLAHLQSGHGEFSWIQKKLPPFDLDSSSPNQSSAFFLKYSEAFGRYLLRKIPPLREHILLEANLMRDAQNVFEKYYGCLTLEEKMTPKQSEQFIEKVRKVMQANGALGVFAEDLPKNVLSEPSRGYRSLLGIIRFFNYQIWPVSIYSDGKHNYHVIYGRIIRPQDKNPRTIITLVMHELAGNLPPELRGNYTRWID